jgi:hypothetical protein
MRFSTTVVQPNMNIGEEVIKHEKERLKKVLKEAETSHNAS